MSGKFFDGAVIAEGMNALLAAYELSKTDSSMVVIDNYKPSLDIDGYNFNYYPGHIFTSQELPVILQELHTVFEIYTNPAYQLILPDRRIDMHYNIQKLMKAVHLRFKEEAPLLEEYLYKEQKLCELLSQLSPFNNGDHSEQGGKLFRRLKLQERLFKERRTANNSFNGLKDRHLTSVFVHAIARFMLPWLEEQELFTDKTIFPLILRKRLYPAGGKNSVKTAIINELIRRNVNVIQDKEVNRIEYGKYFTITYAHDQTVRSKKIIIEPRHEKSISLLPFDTYKGIKKHFYADNIFIGLKRSCLPELYGRANNAIMVCDYDQPLANDNLIFMDTNPLTDIKRAKDEMAALTVTVLIAENSISKISAIRHSVLERIRRFMPFFDDSVENIYFTEPSVIWDSHSVPVYRKGVLLINDEFINLYTADAKYAYITKQVKRLFKTL